MNTTFSVFHMCLIYPCHEGSVGKGVGGWLLGSSAGVDASS